MERPGEVACHRCLADKVLNTSQRPSQPPAADASKACDYLHSLLPGQTSRFRSGPVRCAVAPWLWSSDLPLRRSKFVLRRKSRLPEMLKPIHCRPSNAFTSGRYACAYATAVPQRAHPATAHPGVFRPELSFPFAIRTRESASNETHRPSKFISRVPPATTTDSKRIAVSREPGEASFITPYRNHHGHDFSWRSDRIVTWPWWFRYGPRH